MNDLANRAKIKASLAELRAELDQLRQEMTSSQDPDPSQDPSQDRSGIGGPRMSREVRPTREEEQLVTATTPLEHLQRLLARSQGGE